jgi:hypothetical protein
MGYPVLVIITTRYADFLYLKRVPLRKYMFQELFIEAYGHEIGRVPG